MIKFNKKRPPKMDHSFGENIGKNTNIKSAENMYKRLCDVRLGFVEFMPQDLSMASNCLELYYKELVIVKNMEISDRLLNESHNLYGLAKKIEANGVTLCSGGKKKKEWFYDILNDLQDCYVATKYYGHEPDSSDFREAMNLLKKQREVVMTILDPTKSWNKKQDTIVMGSKNFNVEEEDVRER